MGEDQIGPAVQRNQPITGGQIATDFPLFGADLVFERGDIHQGVLFIVIENAVLCGSEFIRESGVSVDCIVESTDAFADESAPTGSSVSHV
jgi:hypothetical protein